MAEPCPVNKVYLIMYTRPDSREYNILLLCRKTPREIRYKYCFNGRRAQYNICLISGVRLYEIVIYTGCN